MISFPFFVLLTLPIHTGSNWYWRLCDPRLLLIRTSHVPYAQAAAQLPAPYWRTPAALHNIEYTSQTLARIRFIITYYSILRIISGRGEISATSFINPKRSIYETELSDGYAKFTLLLYYLFDFVWVLSVGQSVCVSVRAFSLCSFDHLPRLINAIDFADVATPLSQNCKNGTKRAEPEAERDDREFAENIWLANSIDCKWGKKGTNQCSGSNWYSNHEKMMPSNEQPGSNHMHLFPRIRIDDYFIIVARGVWHAMEHKLFKIISNRWNAINVYICIESTSELRGDGLRISIRTIFRHRRTMCVISCGWCKDRIDSAATSELKKTMNIEHTHSAGI